MSGGATCPSCGVAVVPGYVRCPKCRKVLPKRPAGVQGGTAIEEPSSRAPVLAIGLIVAVAVIGAIAYLVVRKKDPATAQAAPVANVQDVPRTESQPAAAPTPVPTPTAPTVTPTGPNPNDVAAELERTLKKQRLWATVTVIGARAEVRSNSCADKAIVPLLDSAAASFKAAGLTKLRCVEESGRAVSERDL